MSFVEALGNLIRAFVDRALMYILILAGIAILLMCRGDEDRRSALYRAGAVLLMGIGMGMFGNAIVGSRRGAR
jgi:hypothetical protein